ncbi:MAG: hypothetical protein ACT4QC_10315 [Planctomycetaceae bacterium]
MSLREEILVQALSLPPEDRAFVAGELERSLGVAPTAECAPDHESTKSTGILHAELRRRSTAFQTGATTARAAADVLVDLERRQANEPES